MSRLSRDLHPLIYPQAAEAGYLCHLFASSLMSRWLKNYSPAAVLVRLLSLSIFLNYSSTWLFQSTGALQPDVQNLSRGLPLWIIICVLLLGIYFSSQQDISIEKDRDDRRRRLILRLKCLYTIAICSLFSLLLLVCIIQIEDRNTQEFVHKLYTRPKDVLALFLNRVGPMQTSAHIEL